MFNINSVKKQKQSQSGYESNPMKVGEKLKETNDEIMSSNGPLTIITDPYENSYLQMKCALGLKSVSSTSSSYLTFNSPNKLSNTPLIDLTPLSMASSASPEIGGIKKSKRDPIVKYDAELAQSIEYELSMKKRRSMY